MLWSPERSPTFARSRATRSCASLSTPTSTFLHFNLGGYPNESFSCSWTLRTLRQKFSWGQDALIRARDTIVLHAELVTPDLMLDVVTDDPDDNRILECAVAGSTKIIVTGDNDLLRLGQYGEIRIIRVIELLNEVASSAD